MLNQRNFLKIAVRMPFNGENNDHPFGEIKTE